MAQRSTEANHYQGGHMLKRIGVLIGAAVFLVNLCGCALLVAGAAGGAGTSVWLAGKISQDVSVSMEKGAQAARKAMSSLKLSVNKETTTDDVVQIIGEYTDGRQIWIDVRSLTPTTSRIEVRVGATGDKDAAEKIMNKIKRYL